MTDLENNINLKKSGLTLKIKVKHQGEDFLRSSTLSLLDLTLISSQ